MEIQRPKPPVPLGLDLHDFSFTPIFRVQLFRSAFHARASDAEWRAGVTLWLKSWDQIPAGSLPDDDVELCRLAEFGRAQKSWKKVREMALHGWFICDDGRLYHRVVAEGVIAAHVRRKSASDKGKAGASTRWRVIDGGRGNGTGNGTGNASAIAQAMPGDSYRQGQGELYPPLTPPTGGDLQRRRSPERARKDAALAVWNELIASSGASPVRSLQLDFALKSVGGWLRIAQRQAGADTNILRKQFCDAYLNSGDVVNNVSNGAAHESTRT